MLESEVDLLRRRLLSNSQSSAKETRAKDIHKVDKFLPGRAAFVYDLDDSKYFNSSNIPTTVFRSKSELSSARYRYGLSVHEHEPVISRLSDVLGYLKGKSYSSSSHSRKGGGKGKKQENGSKVRGDGGEAGGPSVRPSIKTVAAAAAAAAEKEEEEEEDIFQDAGTDFNNDDDNDLEGGDGLLDVVEDKGYAQAQVQPSSSSKYFGSLASSGDKEDGEDEGLVPGGAAEGAVTYTYRDLEDGDDGLDEVKAKKHETLGEEGKWHRAMKTEEEDAYGDLYPGYDTSMYDDDDDDDDGDAKGDAANLKVADDKDVTAAAATKSNKGKGGASTKDVKLNTEYSKMKQLFQDKGFGNEAAFAEEEQVKETKKKKKGQTKKKKHAEEGDATFLPRQKRLRL